MVTKTNGERARAARAKAAGVEPARHLAKRDLAAWVMSVRCQLEKISAGMMDIHAAVKDPAHLLHDALADERLGEAARDLEALGNDLMLLLVDCDPGDPVGYAQQLVDGASEPAPKRRGA